MKTIEKICKHCDKPFHAPLTEHNRGRAKFCSLSCSSKYHGQKVSASKIPNVTCSYCGKKFYKKKSQMKNSKSGLFFCCREHKDFAQRIGGITEIMPPHYNTGSSNYRKKALKTFINKCNRCGYNKYLTLLQVHHIDRNRTNSNTNNLEILCPTCHYEEHYENNDGMFSS